MRALLIAILIAALGWSGYWWYGARTLETQIETWLSERQAEGWVANYDSVTTRGFPNRFDTTITAPQLADPETGVAWDAPFLQFLRLSYQPQHMIAVWPDTQTLATPSERLTLTTEGMQGSLVLRPGLDLELDRTTIESGPFGIASTRGWATSGSSAQAAIRQTPAQAQTYDIALALRDLTPPEVWATWARRTGIPAGTLGRAELEATVVFDGTWNLAALERERPQPQRIDLTEARVRWGDITLQTTGTLDVDSLGRLNGELSLRATNWQTIVDVAESAGALPTDLANLVRQGLTFLSRMGGSADRLNTTLSFRDGSVSLAGMVPLGQAPRMVIR